MTGTPIQNRPTDLGSLLEFLHLEPFSDSKIFDSMVVKPWLKSGDRDVSRLRKLIRYISLCRTKTVIDLPPSKSEIRFIEMSPEEQALYDSAKNRTEKKLDEALAVSPLAPGMYLNALEWLNDLRLLCNHGLMHSRREPNKSSVTISHGGSWNKSTAKKAFEILVSSGGAVCKLCQTNMAAGTGEADGFENSKPSLSRCLTLICGSCIQNRPGGEKVPGCECNPVCPIAEVSWAPEISYKQMEAKLPTIEEGKAPSKLKALLRDLQERQKSEKR